MLDELHARVYLHLRTRPFAVFNLPVSIAPHSSRANDVQRVLAAILQAAARTESLNELLATVYARLGEIMDTSNFYVGLYDPDTHLYSFPFSVDQDDDDFTPQDLRDSLTDYVRRTGEPVFVDSDKHQELVEAGLVGYVGGFSPIWLGVPLRTGSGTIGVAVVQSYTDAGRFSRADLDVMEMVCDGVARSVELAWAAENRAAGRRLEVRQLEASRDEALRASQAKSSFLANMSHELRTPLNAIIGYSELLMDEHADRGRIDTTAELENIHEAANHLLRIINDILDLSRIEAGKEKVIRTSFTLGELAAQVRALSMPIAERASVQLALVALDDHRLNTDRGKLLQIVMNLVSNACKFAQGRSVTIRMGSPTVMDEGAAPIRIEVADTGDGIDPDVMARLFEPFEQGDDSTTRVHGGTGLGLAISRRYARLLGGDLTAKSLPGRGSSFRLEFPADFTG